MPNWIFIDEAKETLINQLETGAMTIGIGIQPVNLGAAPTNATTIAAINAALQNNNPQQFMLNAAATVNGVSKRESAGDIEITANTGNDFDWNGLALLLRDNNNVWTPVAVQRHLNPAEVWVDLTAKKFKISVTFESKVNA